jgi:Glycosyltransferases, probably involved in cell wall biogenesis
MPKVSVIISVYNKIEFLKLVLAGFERQTEKDFEVIVADDGSSEENVKHMELLLKDYSFSVSHLWHGDKNFRKNRILNKAIMLAQSNYLIFIDGDCVPHKKFVEEHYGCSKKNTCLTGRRVNYSEKITKKITIEAISAGYLESIHPDFILDGIFGKSVDVEKGIYLKSRYLRNFFNVKKRGIIGCNFSLFKDDMLKINGFDERYEAASVGEDSDIEYRLKLAGVEIQSVNHIAVQYHLHHKKQPRPQKNLDLFEKIKESNLPFTPFGIKKLK